MPASKTDASRSVFDLKSASLPVVAVVLKTADANAISVALLERFVNEPDFFDNDALILDLSAIQESDEIPDFALLKHAFAQLNTQPVAVRNANEAQVEAARREGLSVAPNAAAVRESLPEPVVEIREVIREVEVIRQAPAAESVFIDKPLRSGQQVYARGADLIVTAVVNFGAEVIADGNVHVYAPLRGRAIAGAQGNAQARIFTSCMEAQLVSIAGIYRTGENELPEHLNGKLVQVRLLDDRLIVEAL